jgi:2-phosphoglycolate phosphatase
VPFSIPHSSSFILANMSFSAVLFDFDGTLADSYDAIAASVNFVRETHALRPLSVNEVKCHVGRGPEYLLHHTVPGGDLAVDLPLYRKHHPTVMVPLTRLLPGARAVLELLHASKRRIGLCSNKPRIFSQDLLNHLEIGPLFDIVIGPEDVPNPKPAPDMLNAAIAQLQLAKEQVLYVGDMVVDIQTARGAGVTVWIVPTGSDELATIEAARPDRILRSLDEFTSAWESRVAGSPS